MIDEINEDTIASEIQMMRAATDSTIIIVEGCHDPLVYLKMFNSDCIQFVTSFGKENAIKAVELLNMENCTSNYFAIVDKDFDGMNSIVYPVNVIETDYHDIEVVMLYSNSFNRICIEYCKDEFKDQSFEIAKFCSSLLLPLTKLRIINHFNNLHLDFSDIEIKKIVTVKELIVDNNKLVKYVLSKTKDAILCKLKKISSLEKIEYLNFILKNLPSEAKLLMMTTEYAIPVIDIREITNGHDLIEIIGIAFQKKYGSIDPRIIGKENFQKTIRLSFSPLEFKNTKMYEKINSWEVVNKVNILLSA